VVTQSNIAGFAVPAVLWLAACFVADIDEGQDVATFFGGALTRAVTTMVFGAFVRWLYVRRHGGSVRSPETLLIAAGFAVLLAAGRLTSHNSG
jgi:hypothetical protein